MRSEIFAGLLVIIVVFTFGNIEFAEASTVTSDFINDGCSTALLDLSPDSCSADGAFYCDDSSNLQDTLQVAGACGDGTGAQCCPAGYECKDDGTGTGDFKCGLSTTDCGDYTLNGGQTACEDNGCFWIADPDAPFCVSRPLDYSCSVYTDSASCGSDVWNLGQEGFGTTACNEYSADSNGLSYVAPQKQCGCIWDTSVAPGTCKLSYDVQQDLYAEDITAPNSFECIKNFTSSACINDEQRVTWTADTINEVGFGGDVTDNTLLSSSECEGGNEVRACGEPVIKLPGFSLFALISSVSIVGLFYFLRREEFD